ncbi:2,3-bisphosphoglycerate-dependent phosphoglycerate mutase [Cryobacterium lactosi]|uniref:2,3-bisphosphoglycerate-dependent phosphoglycerate mutase n=1 Tax=Cryobacterium lactosi TaxID=1259202 RepID=A0A4R9BYJ7_9MICO|nr:2,3-bisphosphoglycerate-dependent phosphoglycerate mutase [Cryobacterium lactosi]TFD94573.1 2,3-bisphosphoglycerate-dependent phosphoglycerate mutase [Cryobacterium lactosi]
MAARPSGGSLVLLRHGQSTANAAGLFTGILDPGLSPSGADEAGTAAGLLLTHDLVPDAVFVSPLQRAAQTAAIVAAALNLPATTVGTDWRLNERNYGALTGRHKDDVRAEAGEEQFLAWRRSVDTAPPPLSDEQFAAFQRTALFRGLPALALTRTESLRNVMARIGDFHAERIVPLLAADRTVLVVAHGNSLRAYCAVLEHLDKSAIHRLNLPTGHPLVYQAGGRRYLDAPRAEAAALALTLDGGT